MGLATLMARKGLKWDSIEGKKEIHRVFERHMYMLIKASLKISKERGLAPWIHKTKWPEGWTPMSTYNRNVDTIADFEYLFDWEALSAEIKANGGIAHSVLCAMMPGESSSKALGSTNSVYPIRSNVIVKTDGDNNIIRWAAVDGDLLGNAYQSVWDISTIDMIHCYAIMQKWCDQGISADLYRRFAPGETKVSEKEVVETYLAMVHYGMKSRYYTNTLRPKVRKMDAVKNLVRNSDNPLSDGGAGVPKTPEKTVDTSPAYDGVHEGRARMDTPSVILDLDLLGDITGVAALPEVAARQQEVQDEYAENAKEHCTTHCAL
jgi:ribonucleoside-diphosphate reductase alpha chain